MDSLRNQARDVHLWLWGLVLAGLAAYAAVGYADLISIWLEYREAMEILSSWHRR